ncbi:TRAF3-interacting protein 1-like [Mytilus edulis]|uniref:TRAF3-interacting protein 1-like n=1 Tax=Mytilus edulis TaxID=6550 RepID=UPI0039EE7166
MPKSSKDRKSGKTDDDDKIKATDDFTSKNVQGKPESKYDDEKDPTILTLWKKAKIKNAEVQAKRNKMTDTNRKRQSEKVHIHSSGSREKMQQQKSRAQRDSRDRRPKNATDNAKQAELKHINGLSQMSSDRFPPQPNTTQRVVYFQNRFIILDSADHHTGPSNSTINEHNNDNDTRRIKSSKMDSMETSFSKINSTTDTKNKTNRKEIEMDATSVTMDARGIDIILTDPDNSSKQIKNMDSFNTDEAKERNTIWRKINRVLLDDRVKASNGQIVLENRNPEEYRILKKVLNILFLTIGITLFVSVIIVVIYAFIVGDEKTDTDLFITTTTVPP